MGSRKTKMNYKVIYISIAILLAIFIVYYLNQQGCEWRIVNCCPENAGAEWKCVKKSSKAPSCEDLILCAQVISPKPSVGCENVKGACTIK